MPLYNTTSSPSGQASPCAINTDLSDLLCVQMRPDASTFEPLDSNNIGLLNVGAALHWLRVKEKRPVSAGWSTAPKLSESGLRDSYREGRNIGVRLGLPSKIGGGYLHLIDLDVRDPAKSDEAWGRLLDIWPEAKTFPTVISGSGGKGGVAVQERNPHLNLGDLAVEVARHQPLAQQFYTRHRCLDAASSMAAAAGFL